jgi:hypothetical protein
VNRIPYCSVECLINNSEKALPLLLKLIPKKRKKKAPTTKTNADERSRARKRFKDIILENSEGHDEKDVEVLAKAIEESLYNILKEPDGSCGMNYKSKFRSLHFNLKDPGNKRLRERLFMGDLSTDHLINLSPEELANEDLESTIKQFKEKGIKNSIVQKEMNAVTKKSHKGEVEMQKEIKEEVVQFQPQNIVNAAYVPLLLSPMLVEEENEEKDADMLMEEASVESSVISTENHSSISIENHNGMDAEDNEDNEDNVTNGTSNNENETSSVDYDDTSYGNEATICWKGKLNLTGVSKLSCTANQLGGNSWIAQETWKKWLVMDSLLNIQGRISSTQALDYLRTITERSSSKDISVILLSPLAEDDFSPYNTLASHFYSMARFGVVPSDHKEVKDIYVVPFRKSEIVSSFPSYLKPLFNLGEIKLDCEYLLCCVIVHNNNLLLKKRQ